jgi:hypothetical protein
MKKKRYLQTNFLKFLIESERQVQKEKEKVEVENPEKVEVEDENPEMVEDETEENISADEIIENLIQKHKNISKEYDDILYGRKRK